MKILTTEYKYNTKQEFESLTSAIEKEIECGNLEEYVDKSWRKERKQGWNGEYICMDEEKIYRLYGSNFTSTKGAENYQGIWEIMRSKRIVEDKSIFESKYKIRGSGVGIFIDLFFEIEYLKDKETSLNIDWSKEDLFYEKGHSNLIKSATEFGIISAFESDIGKIGKFKVIIKRILYHKIDTSFSLLKYASNRNIKRALFTELQDDNPKIENGYEISKFRPNFTIGRINNK